MLSQSRSALNKLATLLVRRARSQAAPEFWTRFGEIPDVLRSHTADRSLLLTEEEDVAYFATLDCLRREPELEHLSDKDIDRELWLFACEAVVRKLEFRDERTRALAIRDLVKRLRRPWAGYEILTVLRHIDVTGKPIRCGPLTVKRLTKRAAANWGFSGSDWLRRWRNRFEDQSVAAVEVQAGSPQRALEKGLQSVDEYLHLLRTGLVGSTRFRMLDEHLLFERSTWAAVRNRSTKEIETVAGHAPGDPMTLDLNHSTGQRVRHFLKHYNRFLSKPIPGRIRLQVDRALHWIGTSMTRDSHDDRIIDLCTALEALLAQKDERLKGEAITLRSMLLPAMMNDGFTDPFIIYDLYARRSEVIHGSGLNVANQRDADRLLLITLRVVAQFTTVVSRRRKIRRMNDLIKAMETPRRLKQAISWLAQLSGPEVRAVAKLAEERLGQAA